MSRESCAVLGAHSLRSSRCSCSAPCGGEPGTSQRRRAFSAPSARPRFSTTLRSQRRSSCETQRRRTSPSLIVACSDVLEAMLASAGPGRWRFHLEGHEPSRPWQRSSSTRFDSAPAYAYYLNAHDEVFVKRSFCVRVCLLVEGFNKTASRSQDPEDSADPCTEVSSPA